MAHTYHFQEQPSQEAEGDGDGRLVEEVEAEPVDVVGGEHVEGQDDEEGEDLDLERLLPHVL